MDGSFINQVLTQIHQGLSYNLVLLKGAGLGQPINLAKLVTVE